MARANFFSTGSDKLAPESPGNSTREISEAASVPVTPAHETASAATRTGPTPGEGTGPRRRGRPPGSTNKSGDGAKRNSKKDNKNLIGSVDQLSKAIMFGSTAISIVTAPEIMCEKDEADALAGPIVDLFAFYKIEPDPEFQVWFNAITAVAVVGGTKGIKIYKRRARERAEARARKPEPAPDMKPARSAASVGLNGGTKPSDDTERMDMLYSPLAGAGPDGRG